jgi:arginine-tRNA-protein transferase
MNANPLRFLLGTEHPCGYLAEHSARSAFVDPEFTLTPARYGKLLDLGFRRSGVHVYRPLCTACNACRPARIPVTEFIADRSQRRCVRRNADLRLAIEPRLTDEHYQLYRNYLAARHADGGMNPEDPHAFRTFLECPWGETEFWCWRLDGRLLAVAVVDVLPQGLSAVYTFFDVDEPSRSLGTHSVLKQIQMALQRRKPYLYLGYWVAGSSKMDYKRRFRPLEILGGASWQPLAIDPVNVDAPGASAHNPAS